MACTFRPSEKAQKAIEKIKRDHGLKINSKALEYVLTNFGLVEKELRATKMDLRETREELKYIKKAIGNKLSADRDYKEMIKVLIPK
jgi:hypothetical protein